MIKFILIIGLMCAWTFSQGSVDIPSNQINIDGESMGIQPGDTIFLLEGTRPELRFDKLEGTAEKPIVITNKSGRVMIDTEAHSAVLFINSSFFRFTGTGGGDTYGIVIRKGGTMGIAVTEFSTDSEIDHIEIHSVGFAGIMAKTDPNCSRKDLRDFVMRNLSFHDNYIHDTGGEGFYIGYSWYPGREVDCSGVQTTIFPHSIQGIKIYANKIENTHWDALQVGCGTANVFIYGNTIENYGLDNELYQNHGVQIGAGTTGDFFNNAINNGPGAGISFFGAGNNRLFNNVISNTGEMAIYQNDNGSAPGRTYQIYNNTIVNPTSSAINLNASITTGNLVANNLIVLGYYAQSGIINASARWTNQGNRVYAAANDVLFESLEESNYRLKSGSTAIDAGYAIPSLKFDRDSMARPANGKYDVGAYEHGSEPFEEEEITVAVDGTQIFSDEVLIYPNPTKDYVIIRFPNTGSRSDVELTLFNSLGQRVMAGQTEVKEGEGRMALTDKVTQGMYYIKVTNKGEMLGVFRIVTR